VIEVGPGKTIHQGEGRIEGELTCCQGTFIRDFQTIKYAARWSSSSVAHEKNYTNWRKS